MATRARRLSVAVVAAAAGALAVLVLPAAPAGATSASITVTASTLGLVSAVPNVSWTDTLNGLDQAPTTTQAIDVSDATGSGAGWNITATSTTFTTGAVSLSTTATTVQSSPNVACDASATCVTATTNVSYPYTLPAAGTAPTATKVFNATANTGMGDQTVTITWKVALPASTKAGTYTSTWTISLVSGP
ncbi:MAG TPA: WxL domain-containing protein [Acidimicrobiales bacterium]|nr:WxL domain-containing protein [Acidimicrobiales bacterium]